VSPTAALTRATVTCPVIAEPSRARPIGCCRVARPSRAATCSSSASGEPLASSVPGAGQISLACRPIASAGLRPNSRRAPRFHEVMRPSTSSANIA
jgi:hypothetical protein